MASSPLRSYHLFLLISVIHLLIFYAFIGHSALQTPGQNSSYFGDGMFNYFLSVSVFIFLIWLGYFILRKKLFSAQMIRLHLLAVIITISIVPLLALKYHNPLPRLSFEDGKGPAAFCGSMSSSFELVILLLAASETFLYLNIRKNGNGRDSLSD